jgi:DTW domain-containing protein YfiP
VSVAPARFVPDGRCLDCAFPEALCVCERIPRLEVPVRFLILRHAS